ncbi:MAG: FAD-binding oxidoreductase [Rhizobiaceae bacterium]|nr:FAD-binding oxidoreductase [Rhizobiaceae bacterium]
MKRLLDLHSGRPVWSAYRAPRVPTSRLARDVRCDVLVVGMGISGAMIAEALACDGRDVICIDRRGPMLGSTAATTALVQFEIDQPLSILSRKIGRAKAERAWRRSRLAIDNLQARIAERSIDCRLSPRPSLYLDGNVLAPSQLREEGVARAHAGLRADHLSPSQLKDRFGIAGRSALLEHGNLALDPRRLTAGLLNAARERGARLYSPVHSAGIERVGDRLATATLGGPAIESAAIVLATGYELAEIVPASHHRVVSTWAIATRPQPRAAWPGQAFIWEASDPYLYMRVTHDGRIICGGEDEDFQNEEARDALIPEKTGTIAQKLSRLFPHIDTKPEFAWAGAFGTTSTGLPLIGRVPHHHGVFAVMGYGGNGITFSQIASELIATAIAGGTDHDADLFSLSDPPGA